MSGVLHRNARAGKLLFRLSVFLLALSGLGQMPIFKRYYLADIPGLGWLADFALLHLLHYVAAAVFLTIIVHRAVVGAALLRAKHFRPDPLDWSIAGAIGIIVATGMMRVFKNFSWFFLSPGEALFADLAHLAAVLLLGILALFRHLLRPKTSDEVRTGSGTRAE